MSNAALLAAMLSVSAPATIPHQQVEVFRQALVHDAKDYDSAKVMKAFAVKTFDVGDAKLGGQVYVNGLCMMAELKNGWGAYTGFQWYLVAKYPSNGGSIDIFEDDSTQKFCNKSPAVDHHDYGPDLAPHHKTYATN